MHSPGWRAPIYPLGLPLAFLLALLPLHLQLSLSLLPLLALLFLPDLLLLLLSDKGGLVVLHLDGSLSPAKEGHCAEEG